MCVALHGNCIPVAQYKCHESKVLFQYENCLKKFFLYCIITVVYILPHDVCVVLV